MTEFKDLIPMMGPVMAALIAGSISFVVTVLAKDQKTSEFRQSWIDSLRSEICELGANLIAMKDIMELFDGSDEQKKLDYLIQRHDDFVKMEKSMMNIRLRINPVECAELTAVLDRIQSQLDKDDITEELVSEFVKKSQKVLKNEWERVKRGELSFRLLKWGSSVLVVLALVVVAIRFISYFQ